jgi:hypothetical protein
MSMLLSLHILCRQDDVHNVLWQADLQAREICCSLSLPALPDADSSKGPFNEASGSIVKRRAR